MEETNHSHSHSLSHPLSIDATGSGKTTLLNILSQRTTSRRDMSTIHDVSGEILVNGSKISANEFKSVSHITHHTSHITHHTSHITHHTSHITHHTSHITT